jgi:HlyD family secretion protein
MSARFERRRSEFILAAILVAVLAFVLFWRLDPAEAGIRFVTEPARRGDLRITITATGTVQPTNQVDVSSELSGTIRKVLVEHNAKVKAGQTLAELDTDKLAASVESSKARLAAAKARVHDAEATFVEASLEYERDQTLFERNALSKQDLDIARAAYERAKASIQSAKAEVAAAAADLRLNETNFAKACICSPINGVVLQRNIEPGQTVAASLQAPVLFTIAEDLSQMEVHVDVDEADVGQVREGQKAIFSVDAHPGNQFVAVIRELRLGSEIVQGVVTYKAILAADNAEQLLRPGMTATAEITVQELSDVLSVPNAALRFSPPETDAEPAEENFLQKLVPGRPRLRPPSERIAADAQRRVWILVDGQATTIPVTIGPTDGMRTQILDGAVGAGQAVIVDTASAGK